MDPTISLVHRLRALAMSLDLLAGRFATLHGLHATDIRALIHLLDAGREGLVPTPGWLSGQLRLNSASVTALLDRLERLGLTRRERDPTDRRRVIVVVEERAVDLGWAFFGPLIEAMTGALRGYDEHDLAVVSRFLADMSAATGSVARA